ncbi:Epithelial sodium channel [Cinara cedri]|uniref:Epithelial sodium channel n=1 Tax=Cinara cedri TaxID=506608 RepID=A0A5E4NJF0_9HEMI|nr:Epithelial sodium channel [Cinara cedri]
MSKLIDWFREYCEKTTAHGMRYFVMKHRSQIEKVYWIVVLNCMILAAFYVLILLSNIWINNPVVYFIENTESEIKELPFPSFRVCPVNQVRKRVLGSDGTTNSSYGEDLDKFMSLICSSNTYTASAMKQHSMEYVDYDVFKKWVIDYSVSCPETFQSHVNWQNTTIPNICDFVQPSLIITGICFTLNTIPMYQMVHEEYYQRISKWNLDEGYSMYSGKDDLVSNHYLVIPARTSGASYYHRFRMVLYSLQKDEIQSCPNTDLADGSFLITLANPMEYSSINVRSFILPDTYTRIQVTPFVKKMNWCLKWRSLETRKCYLQNERKLSIFKMYTESNCNYECMINETISMCGCILFEAAYLTKGVKLCGPAKKDCILRAIRNNRFLHF